MPNLSCHFKALSALPLTVHAAVCSMDIDGNGRIEATTDGLLMTRYILGIRGPALTNGALGVGAARTDPADIAAYLACPCIQGGWVGQGSALERHWHLYWRRATDRQQCRLHQQRGEYRAAGLRQRPRR